jgi:hypothetical protein
VVRCKSGTKATSACIWILFFLPPVQFKNTSHKITVFIQILITFSTLMLRKTIDFFLRLQVLFT